MVFENRESAGKLLAERLNSLRGESLLVLAISGGGVPVARAIAENLDADLDLILIEKVGAPLDPEYTIGTLGESGLLHLNETAGYMDVPDRYLAEQIDRRMIDLRELRARYSPYRAAIPFEGRTVILVDDGITSTDRILGAVREVRGKLAKRVIVAGAVIVPRVAQKLQRFADEVVALETPENLYAVSQFFENFEEVTHADVSRILESHVRERAPDFLPNGLYRGDERVPPYDQRKIGGY